MKEERPLIFISNDDGYSAKGLTDLIEMVREMGDVIVVAPEGSRSGSSTAITCDIPVRLRLIREEPGLQIYACSGTPCDCVKLAFDYVLPHTPDIILAGINHGDNAAVNTHYSGTMAVAFEGTMKQVPSVAFSSCMVAADADFSPLTSYVRKIVQTVLSNGLPDDVCLNVNFPDRPFFQGIKVCRMGRGEWTNEWERRIDTRHRAYFWLTGSLTSFDADDPATDRWALNNGYVAITPTQLDMTAYKAMEKLTDTFSHL